MTAGPASAPPAGSGEYVIQDPYHPYAIHLLRLLRQQYGWKAICYYTNADDLRRSYSSYPQLQDPDLVAASYRVAESGMDDFIAHLAARHDVRAVVPHYEPAVVNAGRIAAGLGLAWNPPDVLARFRDKESLKAHLRRVDPDLRLNVSQVVHSPTEALAVAAEHGLSRFVLKPNDGFGNVGVGFFDADVPLARLEDYWGSARALLLEEFISGEEYHCDGQVDGTGGVTITDAFRYTRTAMNGRENIQQASTQVPHDSDLFGQLAEYATRVVTASGLVRSPFHCEIKVDDRGPCLIECAARLVGLGTARIINFVHGGGLDVFAVAAHYYATAEPYGPIPVNWRAYDSRLVRKIAGAVEDPERVFNLQGLEQVQAMPQFLFWVKRPEVGERLQPTVDIFGSAFIAVIQGPDEAALDRTAHRVRDLVGWNGYPVTVGERAKAVSALGRRRLSQVPKPAERRMPLFT